MAKYKKAVKISLNKSKIIIYSFQRDKEGKITSITFGPVNKGCYSINEDKVVNDVM